MTDRVTVQVVDDHFLFASSLASVIKEIERYRLVGIAVTGPQALAMVREERPDIVLLDFHLPGYSADMLIPRFLAVSPATRVIVLTSDTSDGAMVSALQAGAIGFMTKDKAIDDVLEALRVVAEGGMLLTPRQVELARVAGGPAPATLPRSAGSSLGGSSAPSSITAPPVDEPASHRTSAPSTSSAPQPPAATSPARQPPAAAPPSPSVPRPSLPEAAPASLTFTPAPVPLPRPDPIELRLVGVGSFAQAVLIERFIDRLPQVDQVYIRDLGGDRASLRVALHPGASADALAKELVDGSRRLRVTGVERGMLELQVEAPLIDG